MQRNLRPNDSFGRLGGEEFGVLLPDTPLADAKAIADRLCNEASQHHVSTEAGPCRYSMSGGLALRLRGETFDEMAMRADRALYEAKLTGRNKICVAGSVHTMVLELESESGNPA
jgi:diguanylate cyclase (GGDEF)-like protein